ncbi:FkbM family methyltransferase [Aminipila sp.]|uniref:FkbM family methyltransferase n=1 Tax=Aminipila sp. TaxID=2060095 RepID=UPI00289798D0|nr:FkbM family methyltransferase [Aminipila sp.]
MDILFFKESVFEILKTTNLPIIIYGAGGQGKRLAKSLKEKNIDIFCFCVSENRLNLKELEGVKVMSYEDVTFKVKKYILLVSVTQKYASEIALLLKQKREKNKYFFLQMPFKVENNFLDIEEISKGEYKNVLELFEDKISKDLFIDILKYKVTGDGRNLYSKISGRSFFEDELLVDKRYTYVDCGAYTGDTIMKFCQFAGLNYNKIVGIEMETGNYYKLKEFVKLSHLENVVLLNKGLWSQKTQSKYFTTSHYNFANANLFANVDDVSSEKEKKHYKQINSEMIEVQTELLSLDEILVNIDLREQELYHLLIKVNAMGADFEILKGAKKVIEQYKPIFVIEFGTKKEHLIEIPKFLKEIKPDYKIYLRQKEIFTDSKTVLYCI